MKTLYATPVVVLLLCFPLSGYAQDSKITVPFDSLELTNVKATGNIKTGVVEILMDFRNGYEKPSTVSLDFGGFDRFGITDAAGKKYKLFTNENLIGTSDVNKGYQPISYIRFGDKTQDWVTLVQQELQPGETKTLTVRLENVDREASTLKEIHGFCILAQVIHIGDKSYRVENLDIKWTDSSGK